MPQNVLVIELNEFNPTLLKKACHLYDLPFISQILNFPSTQYISPDNDVSGYLEPWVQWVSIHAGLPASKHKIKHLGDVPDLTFEQCWETLDKHSIRTGVWGVMNGAKRNTINTSFFLPDPWTFSEVAFPAPLNHLLDLPRYISKNYQNLEHKFLFKKAAQLLYFILRSKNIKPLLKQTAILMRDFFKRKKKHYLFISYFDYLSTLLFVEYKQKYQPQCSFIFLNSLAHLQHHHWRESPKEISSELYHGLKMLDKILGLLLATQKDEAIIMHNGLSQMNTNQELPWVLYRQKDPICFLKALGISFVRVEQHMTHDGHVFFADVQARDNAFEALQKASINDQALFLVEKNANDTNKLFYQLQFTDKLIKDQNPTFIFQGKSYPFFNYFDEIVTRTGRHIPEGMIYSNIIKFENGIYNHEFNQYLYHYLLADIYPYPQPLVKQVKEEALLDT